MQKKTCLNANCLYKGVIYSLVCVIKTLNCFVKKKWQPFILSLRQNVIFELLFAFFHTFSLLIKRRMALFGSKRNWSCCLVNKSRITLSKLIRHDLKEDSALRLNFVKTWFSFITLSLKMTSFGPKTATLNWKATTLSFFFYKLFNISWKFRTKV